MEKIKLNAKEAQKSYEDILKILQLTVENRKLRKLLEQEVRYEYDIVSKEDNTHVYETWPTRQEARRYKGDFEPSQIIQRKYVLESKKQVR